MFGYDPEVPAGYQDADIEMRELNEAADEQHRACKRGEHIVVYHKWTGKHLCEWCLKEIDNA